MGCAEVVQPVFFLAFSGKVREKTCSVPDTLLAPRACSPSLRPVLSLGCNLQRVAFKARQMLRVPLVP